ncbi:Integral membrane protein TmpA [Quillaja saponaria]|uniref:Integral membrane protein TmpA n=1 Tax=Quillaja saponaria TaxID=32244 RepID=A0AAD7KYV8_QUISA|nr:Integral membrane protein TmpA [Quillaja saponaria]
MPVWLPWNRTSSFKVIPWLNPISPSGSPPSSHFCDIDIAGYDIEQEFIAEFESKDIEKGEKANAVLKRNSRLSIILLDQGLFTVYKRLFMVCLTLNMIALAISVAGHFPYAKRKASLFSIGNILALTLCRSEAVLRIVFWLAVKLLGRPWINLQIKTATTSFLQSLGGIHSGCGMSSIAWLVYALILTLNDKDNTTPEIIAVAFTILLLIFLSSIAAFPLFRHIHHNVFERTHRFTGWIALIFLWFFVILSLTYKPLSKTYDLKFSRLAKQQEFWFTLAITVLIIIPWLTVRKVPVSVLSTSGHASIIKFEGGVHPGLLGRISPSPLSEWHAFGIISDGKKEHMMLAGAVGDFTKSLISKPPSHLWVRKVHFAGLPYLVNMYQRAVLVATGSGICVFLSFLLQPCQADVCLIWVAKEIELNYGKEIKELVSKHPRKKVIVHDTAIGGRPNVAKMSVDAAIRWNAEAVVVTSNPEGSRDIIRECKRAGIPAFGPIWDS